MKECANKIWKTAKDVFGKHKKGFKRLGISMIALLVIAILGTVGCYVYFQNKYPKEIILEDAYYDITALDFAFSDKDLQASYEVNEAVYVNVSEGAIFVENSDKIMVEEQNITVKQSGTYIFSGEIKEGMLCVEAGEEDKVQLIFNDFNLSNSKNPAIYIKSADKVIITTMEDTENNISDGKDYSMTDGDSNIDAAIFSKADLTFNGQGTLCVNGNTAHAVVSKDDLVIGSGKYEITSVKKGITGKDCVKIADGTVNINAGTDGICSNNQEDAQKGYIYIENGDIRIVSGNDGIQAANVLYLKNPTIDVMSGGGNVNAPEKEADNKRGRYEEETTEEEVNTESTKGLKSAKDVIIQGGMYTIDSCDDSVHGDNSVKIEDGVLDLKSGDDGIHAEHTLQITGGKVSVDKCYEGLEGYQIGIYGGEISITASDDGLNASSGSDAGNAIKGFFAPSILGKLEITDGFLSVNTGGDSLDSNGVMNISGGTTLIAGPSGRGDGLVDCDSDKIVNGGTIIGIGMSDDTQEDLSSSGDYFDVENQAQVIKVFDTQSAGTSVEIQHKQGNVIEKFVSSREFNYMVITAPGLSSEEDCIILLDGDDRF